MNQALEKLFESGCEAERKEKLCRSRGGESCAFDGAMIVLQPIADTAHIVHGPINCCGNSWEGRGTESRKGELHKMGFTTDMSELDIVYGAEDKLCQAVRRVAEEIKPSAIFVHATCVSGMTGEDIEAICRKAAAETGMPVIPVNAPGFVGPKNLGNRIAGDVLLDHVIGTAEPKYLTGTEINLIGEYNIAGDLWQVEPLFRKAGIRLLSAMTGNASFDEIRTAHRAKLNVVVCSRALINIAKGMEQRYGIPYVEVSFYGKTEMAKALRAIAGKLGPQVISKVEEVIAGEERKLEKALRPYDYLKGKKAVLYSGGVKSWSFISALLDLGIGIAGVGTKKSSFEDEEKMKEILGPAAPLLEDVTPKNLLCLLREKGADMLIAGGRNQYLAVKEGYPFVDVNQERHIPYAGYAGLVGLARQIDLGMRIYGRKGECRPVPKMRTAKSDLLINPIKHSQALGAAIAFQGLDNSIPVIHGAQGCGFLGKVLLTKHFREPIALASTKLFTEDVVLGSDERLEKTVTGLADKNRPAVIGVLSTGLTEVKGDDIPGVLAGLPESGSHIIHVSTPDYSGGLEDGYAAAVCAMTGLVKSEPYVLPVSSEAKRINLFAGSHLTPADFRELRALVESFCLDPIFLPDLSSLDGSRTGFSALASGGTNISDIKSMSRSAYSIAVGLSMEKPAVLMRRRFGTKYAVFESLAGLSDVNEFVSFLTVLSDRQAPPRLLRDRNVLRDSLRDAQFYLGNARICLALEPDHAVQMSRLLDEAGATVACAIVPRITPDCSRIVAKEVKEGGLSRPRGRFDLLIANSHGTELAGEMGVPIYQTGFPSHKILGATHRVTVGYRGTLNTINDIASLLMTHHGSRAARRRS